MVLDFTASCMDIIHKHTPIAYMYCQVPQLSPQDLLDAEAQAQQHSSCFPLFPHCGAKGYAL